MVRRFWTVLTGDDRELLTRYYVESEPPEQIGRSLNISIGEFFARRERAAALLTFGITIEPSSEATPALVPAVIREIADAGAARPSRKRTVKDIDWAGVCNQVRQDDPAAAEQLYERLRQDLRFYLDQQIERAAIEDIIQETVFVVFSAITAGKVRASRKSCRRSPEPSRAGSPSLRSARGRGLPGTEFISRPSDGSQTRGVWRTSGCWRGNAARSRRRSCTLCPGPRPGNSAPLLHQAADARVICVELGLTSTQFRLLKSRAKARLADKVLPPDQLPPRVTRQDCDSME